MTFPNRVGIKIPIKNRAIKFKHIFFKRFSPLYFNTFTTLSAIKLHLLAFIISWSKKLKL